MSASTHFSTNLIFKLDFIFIFIFYFWQEPSNVLDLPSQDKHKPDAAKKGGQNWWLIMFFLNTHISEALRLRLKRLSNKNLKVHLVLDIKCLSDFILIVLFVNLDHSWVHSVQSVKPATLCNTPMCFCQYIFPKQLSQLYTCPREIYLAALSIGLMWHRCFEQIFPLLLCFWSFFSRHELGSWWYFCFVATIDLWWE